MFGLLENNFQLRGGTLNVAGLGSPMAEALTYQRDCHSEPTGCLLLLAKGEVERNRLVTLEAEVRIRGGLLVYLYSQACLGNYTS